MSGRNLAIDHVAVGALIVSALSLVVSLVSAAHSIRTARRQDHLNRLHIEKEEKLLAEQSRAELGANIVTLGSGKHRLKIFNKGPSPAQAVSIEFPEGNNLVPEDELAAKFPHPRLEPHQAIDLLAMVGRETQRRQTIKIKWSEPDGKEREKTFYPTV